MINSSVKEYDEIRVGNSTRAIVCATYSEKNRCEVVYLSRNRAINEDVVWDGNNWQFVTQGPCGGYADQSPRLSPYVSKLRTI